MKNGLVHVVAACLVVWGAGCITRVERIVYVDRTTGERSDQRPAPMIERTIEVTGSGGLIAAVAYGSVSVQADASATQIKGTVVVAEEVADDAKVELLPTGLVLSSKSGKSVMIKKASFIVPPATPVAASSGQGDLAVSGLRTVPKLNAAATSGAVTISDCREIGAIDVASSYGKVQVLQTSATSIAVKSGQGDMVVQDVQGLGASTSLSAKATSGAISLTKCTGFESISAATSYGRLTASSVGKPKLLELSSGQGDMTVRDATGNGSATLSARASSGALIFERCTGFEVVEGQTSYGRVKVAAVTPVNRMVLKSGQGDTTVSGVVASGEKSSLTVSATSGAITISACPGFATMGATTSYGRVTVKDLDAVGAMTVSSGQGDASVEAIKSADGVSIATTSGSVSAARMTCKGKLAMKAGYGDVSLDNCEAAEADLQSTRGEIKLHSSKLGKMSIKGKVANVDWTNVTIGK